MNGYELSRNWFNWSFENPEKVKPNHTALYLFAVEHCNRLGWKNKFGLPTEMTKDAIGIKSYNTYINTFNDLVKWGFFELIEKSKNQYSSNIIALSNFNKALDKALDKAFVKHVTKQGESTGESTGESIYSIIKQLNHEQLNHLRNEIELLLSPKDISTKYEKDEFLKNWNEVRTQVLKKESHLNRLDTESKNLLKQIASSFDNPETEITKALKGFFKQNSFPKGQDYTTNFKHFLNHFSKYHQAYYDQNPNIYGKVEQS